jgi:signal transduction histidine kinase/ActR/RegA family two-component response regulator
LPFPRVDATLDGTLVRLEGVVQDSNQNRHSRWSIRTESGRFDAWADHPLDLALPEGAGVAVSGIYRVEYDEYRQPRAFTVQLRDERDIHITRAPPWLTAPRALVIFACFAGFVLLGLAWVIVLRRRVRSQTEQIRRQLETESRLNAELERANRLESLGVLAGGIAHDFNNLLTVITANIGLATMDDRVREAAGDLLSEAERGAQRAADITQQLLTFARGGDPVRTAVALPDVVRESAQFASHGARTRCVFENAPDLPPADVDRAQIGRVVHNLVLNAVQAMHQGGTIRIGLSSVEIRAGAKEPLKPGCYVKLTVADDGPGISQDHLARIFEPYFSTKQSNNGLGLATVHSIVKKHQGHIEVRSADGDGTTFEVWLPAATKPAVVPVTPTAVSASGQLRVLFMDDEEVIRRMAEKAMKQLGHSCVIVPDGMAAVREYEKSLNAGARFDAVVLDLTVPGGVGGRAAIELLRRIDPSVRAIVSSGYSSDPVLANFQKYGFCAIVAKPYTVAELGRTLNETVQRSSARKQPVAVA